MPGLRFQSINQMTIEELSDLPVDQLEALTVEQLTEILKPKFPTTRPELVVRPVERKNDSIQMQLSPQKKAALAMLADEGVDLSFLKRKFK